MSKHADPPVAPAPPLCSICIANYNGEKVLRECLDSVLEQDPGFPFEILVHDDASTDDSIALVREEYPTVRLIESKTNVGFCVSNNRMVEAAHGEFVLLLNNDASLLAGALKCLMETSRQMPGPSILGLAQYDAESCELIDYGALLDPFFNTVPNRDPTRREVAMVAGACLWVPRALWNQWRGFPDWFGSVAEDLYLCTVARLSGVPVIVAQGSGYKHRVGYSLGGGKLKDGGMATTVRRRALSERNRCFTMAAVLPSPWVAPWLLAHLLLLQVEGMLLSAVRRDAAPWRSIYWPCLTALWQHRERIIALRSECQRRRSGGLKILLGGMTPWPYKLRMLLSHGLPRLDAVARSNSR